MTNTNKNAPADAGTSVAGASIDNQVQDTTGGHRNARIYRDPPFGILFVGEDLHGGFHILRKSEISRNQRQCTPGTYSSEESAQRSLDTMAHNRNLEEMGLL